MIAELSQESYDLDKSFFLRGMALVPDTLPMLHVISMASVEAPTQMMMRVQTRPPSVPRGSFCVWR